MLLNRVYIIFDKTSCCRHKYKIVLVCMYLKNAREEETLGVSYDNLKKEY